MDDEDKFMHIPAIPITIFVVHYLVNTGRILKAIELCKECLILLDNETLEKEKEFRRPVCCGIYSAMFNGYMLLSDYTSGIQYGRKLLVVLRGWDELRARARERRVTYQLAFLYECQGKYREAKELYNKAHSIAIDIGDEQGEAACYGSLGKVFQSLGQFGKAEEYQKKALEIGDRHGEAVCYENLGKVFESLGEYRKAEDYLKKALVIGKEICDREVEAACYRGLGSMHDSIGEYVKAKEYREKALVITKDIGNRHLEAACYGGLGHVHYSIGEYGKAAEYHKKALGIRIHIGHREGEAWCYGNLGTIFRSLGEYCKAKEYHEKALAISKEIGDLDSQLKIHL